jgi:hypothetical protein
MTIKLEAGKRYVTRSGLITSKLTSINGTLLYEGRIDDKVHVWNTKGIHDSNGLYDITEPLYHPTSTLPEKKAKSDKVGTGLTMLPFYSILRIGAIFVEGLHYGRDNWKKGVNDKEYQEERLEHAMLHLIKWKEGDRTEDHLAKVAWFCVTQLELERLEQCSESSQQQ